MATIRPPRPSHRRATSALALVLGLFLFVGCGSGGQGSTAAPATTAPGTTAAAATASADRTVVDMTGRSVRIPAQVTRVATGFAALNATMLVLGAADRLVATSSGVSPLYPTLVPTYKDVALVFDSGVTTVNKEALLAARPQVILLFVGAKALLPTFDQLGIPTVVFASFQTPAQIKQGVSLVADVLGGEAPARAKKFGEYYDGNIARVEKRTAGLTGTQITDVYYTSGSPTKTEAKNSIVELWLTQAGGRNLAAAHGINTAPAVATVGLEDVVGWDPKVIISKDAATDKQIRTDPKWSGVAAVRTGRTYVNPTGVYVWSVRSAESALQPLWAAKTLHPELFGDVDMAKEVRYFYSTFYSYQLSDAQVRAILNPTAA
ncbi:ABC transporter substrate-binding protein [Frankia sp. AiPs1]|uniref:ABC transporter substrate-binding protein n=1 Tax=Frankia sp. AiPs1 TaxID=573493 RepID=UPI0020446EE2|nr:ABC transporter substrate-binding protein [Frankia sp. AiPs1]MCM3922386.1 ABC transporter substrate-binding protein [Frankia sp. AiPs1]